MWYLLSSGFVSELFALRSLTLAALFSFKIFNVWNCLREICTGYCESEELAPARSSKLLRYMKHTVPYRYERVLERA